MEQRFNEIISFIKKQYKDTYGKNGAVPLHAPVFVGKEKEYLSRCIDSTFVSYVGEYVTEFEDRIKEYTGAKYCAVTVNGTSALQLALQCSGVMENSLVIVPALTFVATANAVAHTGAEPVFLGSAGISGDDKEHYDLGLSPEILHSFLTEECEVRETPGAKEPAAVSLPAGIHAKKGTVVRSSTTACFHKRTGKRISACIPVHVFGHPCRIDEIAEVCGKFGVPVIEDAAESLGSFRKNIHTGNFGSCGVLSFNGNKIVTTGGGGAVVTNDGPLAESVKHLSTTAKVPHPWEFYHDQVGFNLRMPNINAAVGCAQMESLPRFLEDKRDLADEYSKFFADLDVPFLKAPEEAISNYWLNAIVLENDKERDDFLACSNSAGVQTRPVWRLLSGLPMYARCISYQLEETEALAGRIVNIPSGVRLKNG